MQRDWIDYAAALGGLSTVLTLIILIFKAWKTKKDITDLSIIATKLAEQTKTLNEQNRYLRLQLQESATPNFVVKSVNLKNTNQDGKCPYLYIEIMNEGERGAKIEKVELSVPDQARENEIEYFYNPAVERLEIRIWIRNSFNPKNGYTVDFKYFDRYSNPYVAYLNALPDTANIYMCRPLFT